MQVKLFLPFCASILDFASKICLRDCLSCPLGPPVEGIKCFLNYLLFVPEKKKLFFESVVMKLS